MADILVVDDDQSIATAFQHFLTFEGHAARFASNAADALQMIAERLPDLIMMDIRMPGVDGLEALGQIRARFPTAYVVMMTGYGTSQTSIDAIRAGAFDYFTKPLDLDELRVVIDRAVAAQRARPAAPPAGEAPLPGRAALVGESPAMLATYKMIGRLAMNDVPALVMGERGTGKRLVMATIHENSARRGQPFVTIDCATTPESPLDAELNDPSRPTLHLAHVESLTPGGQARLAAALSATAGPHQITARVLASTEHNLPDLARSGAFNRALFDALSIITLELPPLRARRDDVPLLVRHFIQRFNAELSRSIRGTDDRVQKMLYDHAWPGNVGELERVIKRASIVARGEIITPEDIGASLSDNRLHSAVDADSALARAASSALHDRLLPAVPSQSPYHDILDVIETALVREALFITNGNQVKAAEILGVNRATLRKKIPSGD